MDLYEFLSINFFHTKDQLNRIRVFNAEEFGSLLKWFKDVLKSIKILRKNMNNQSTNWIEETFNYIIQAFKTFYEWVFNDSTDDECPKKSKNFMNIKYE